MKIATRIAFCLLALAILPVLGGCTHIAGQVLMAGTHTPVAGAEVSVGRPGGMDVHKSTTTDAMGHFSMDINPLDTDDLFVWSGHGDPNLYAQQVNPQSVSDHMKVYLEQVP
ncbi:MAG: hypothetical protein ACP5O7_05855 [Phycisphaerae bacterium]